MYTRNQLITDQYYVCMLVWMWLLEREQCFQRRRIPRREHWRHGWWLIKYKTDVPIMGCYSPPPSVARQPAFTICMQQTLWHPLAADPTPTSHIPTPLWPFWMVFGTTIKPRHSEHLGILSVNDACVGKAFKRSVVGLCDHRHTSLSGWQPLWSKPRDSITTMIGHTSHQNLCIYRVTACLLTKYL